MLTVRRRYLVPVQRAGGHAMRFWLFVEGSGTLVAPFDRVFATMPDSSQSSGTEGCGMPAAWLLGCAADGYTRTKCRPPHLPTFEAAIRLDLPTVATAAHHYAHRSHMVLTFLPLPPLLTTTTPIGHTCTHNRHNRHDRTPTYPSFMKVAFPRGRPTAKSMAQMPRTLYCSLSLTEFQYCVL